MIATSKNSDRHVTFRSLDWESERLKSERGARRRQQRKLAKSLRISSRFENISNFQKAKEEDFVGCRDDLKAAWDAIRDVNNNKLLLLIRRYAFYDDRDTLSARDLLLDLAGYCRGGIFPEHEAQAHFISYLLEFLKPIRSEGTLAERLEAFYSREMKYNNTDPQERFEMLMEDQNAKDCLYLMSRNKAFKLFFRPETGDTDSSSDGGGRTNITKREFHLFVGDDGGHEDTNSSLSSDNSTGGNRGNNLISSGHTSQREYLSKPKTLPLVRDMSVEKATEETCCPLIPCGSFLGKSRRNAFEDIDGKGGGVDTGISTPPGLEQNRLPKLPRDCFRNVRVFYDTSKQSTKREQLFLSSIPNGPAAGGEQLDWSLKEIIDVTIEIRELEAQQNKIREQVLNALTAEKYNKVMSKLRKPIPPNDLLHQCGKFILKYYKISTRQEANLGDLVVPLNSVPEYQHALCVHVKDEFRDIRVALEQEIDEILQEEQQSIEDRDQSQLLQDF